MTLPEGELLPGSSWSGPGATDLRVTPAAALGAVVASAWSTILDPLPNDLTRMIYLASLRDCNSGLYLHHELSPALGIEDADRVLGACHEEVFRRLLATSLSGYVFQLEEYIQYTRTEASTVVKTWESLQAYRATVPVRALSLSSELFSLNIEVALAVLRERNVAVT
jgi:hypothetical protein